MGAVISNRNPGDDYYRPPVSPSFPIDQSYYHIPQKSWFSVSPAQGTPENSHPRSSNSIVLRISQYPDRKPDFRREVHAPVRNLSFGFQSSCNKISETTAFPKESPDMGRFSSFFRLRNKKPRLEACKSTHYVTVGKKKENEAIEFDSEDENLDDVADDSSIEEVKIVNSIGSKRKAVGRVDIENPLKLYVTTAEKEVSSFDSSVVTDVSSAIAKIDEGDKTVSTHLDHGADDSGFPAYKRLHNWTKRIDRMLAHINYDIDINEKIRQWLGFSRPQKKEEQIKKDECFMPLTEEEESEVSYALSDSNKRKVLVTHENSNIVITGENLQCLRPRSWLNDEVINLYLELLKEREKREPKKFLKCHFFNTFFYKKLISGRGGYNYQSVRRWTTQRKLGYNLLECDKIFVPIHKENHWCLAIINKKDKKFQYLDSLKGVDFRVLNVLAKYFDDEVKDKCGKDINVSSWPQESVSDLPEQENGFDCGVFMIKYADFYSRDIRLCFSQKHMPYFRRRTAKEILKLRAE